MPDTPIQTIQLALDVGTATAGGASTLTDTTKDWATNQWGSSLLQIVSGLGVGQSRVISSNTATVITTTSAWTVVPNTTSTYAIVPTYPVVRKGVDIASAGALALGVDGQYFHVTGAVGITSIASRPAGTIIALEFDSTPTLTYNAASLILQGAVNFVAAAGDVLMFVSEGSGNWRELSRRLAAAAAGGGLTLVGSDLVERTTNATGADAANLSSVSGISIVAGTPVRVQFRFRKTIGAATNGGFGIKINATQVYSTSVTSGGQNWFTGNNQAEDGLCYIDILPGETNYQTQILFAIISKVSATGANAVAGGLLNKSMTSLIPIAPITSITLTGDAVNALVTIATNQLRVYTYP